MASPLFPCVVAALTLAACGPATTPTPVSATAPPPPNSGMVASRPSDIAYCLQLASLYERYGSAQYFRGNDFDAPVAEAINQCHAGDPDGGIATLSRLLTGQDITVPPRPK